MQSNPQPSSPSTSAPSDAGDYVFCSLGCGVAIGKRGARSRPCCRCVPVYRTLVADAKALREILLVGPA
jgi:hypothetical protein